MKIAIIHANHYTDRQGGGELTTKYWYEQGIKEGLDITWVHNKNLDITKDFDFYLIGDFGEFKNYQYILKIIKTKRHAFLVHNSINWTPSFGRYYSNAEFIVTLAPDHAQNVGIEHNNIIVTAPYVDHKLFNPTGQPRNYKQLYIGLIHPLKVQYSMIKYVKEHPEIDFHLYGDLKMEMTPIPNYKVYPMVDNSRVPELMNTYRTFFWHLDRYGCYGRTIVEALLCNMELNISEDRFGLMKYPWIKQGRNAIIDNLENYNNTFWPSILDRIS